VAERRVRRRCLAAALALLCAGLLAGCGNTLQNEPLSASTLEPLVLAEGFPVFWLGASFHGMPLSVVNADPSGAYEVQYGECATGGPETCISPLAVISSPDNSFLPGAGAATDATSIRGVHALIAQRGKTIELATGAAVVDIQASSPALALAAAREMAPVNRLGSPGASLPAALPETGFPEHPTEEQRLPTVQDAPAGR
jgi:hypothetical protein